MAAHGMSVVPPISMKALTGYGCIAALGVCLALAVQFKAQKDNEAALANYREASMHEAEAAVGRVNEQLKLVYQGIRTISQLPSVRAVDRYGKTLNTDAHAAIEQIYHNMVSNVAVSEIYIVPVDLEPEQIDPNTGSLETPILMYDGSEDQEEEGEAEPEPTIDSVEKATQVEEVEIYEYRALKEQMAYLKKQHATQGGADQHLPMIGSRSVLTCDNAEYEKTKRDADRAGIMFSVPFFSPEGRLKGTVTAVVRDNVMRGMLPKSDFALINEMHQYTGFAVQDGQQNTSIKAIASGSPDEDLIFSAVLPLDSKDPQSEWKLWVGYPNTRFHERGDLKAALSFKRFGYGFSGIVTLLGGMVWSLTLRAQMRRKRQEFELEQQKQQAMHEMADHFESSVKEVVSQVASSAHQMQSGAESMTSIAADTKQRSATVVTVSSEVSQVSSQVSVSASQLTSSIQEISAQTQLSSEVAREASCKAEQAKAVIDELSSRSAQVSAIVGVVSGIASKINLLALNATIESARAGDAGHGFAVVASEVKMLADQVAKATSEINRNIQEMQQATQCSVTSIAEILEIIGRVSRTTSTVAAAVEEQSTATNEIARSIARASEATSEIAQNIGMVQEGAERTGETSQQVLNASRNLTQQSAILKERVEEFLCTVRNA
jgi:methyl-accepting chemotaxis protein